MYLDQFLEDVSDLPSELQVFGTSLIQSNVFLAS